MLFDFLFNENHNPISNKTVLTIRFFFSSHAAGILVILKPCK